MGVILWSFTLGVEGGYTQKDVIEVARYLTSWTIDCPNRGGEFIFRPRLHDTGDRVVLGHKIKGRLGMAGMQEGLEVLHILAHHPSTAHLISLKLCRRFVSDDPPLSLVSRASDTFLKTDGDIHAVLKTILSFAGVLLAGRLSRQGEVAPGARGEFHPGSEDCYGRRRPSPAVHCAHGPANVPVPGGPLVFQIAPAPGSIPIPC
jgi:hypothetical protein